MSTATMADTNSAGTTLFAAHFKKITFGTHTWEGRRQSGAVDATIKGEKIAAARTSKPRVSLLPEHLQSCITDARAGVYKALNRHTIACDAAGTRLLSVRNAATFLADWTFAVAKFEAVADTVAFAYDEIIAYNRDYWLPLLGYDEVEYQRHIGRLIPSKSQMRDRFSVTFHQTEPGSAESSEYEDAAVAEFFEAARLNAAEHQKELLDALIREPVARLAESLDALKARIADGKKLSPGTFSEVTDAIALCTACSDVIAPHVMASIRHIGLTISDVVDKAEEHKSSGGAYTTKIKQHSSTLVSAIDGAMAACQDEEAQTAIRATYGGSPVFLFDDEVVGEY